MKVKAILVFVFFSYLSFGQSPQKFTYQSIIKNSSGYLLKNQDVGLRISVLSNSSNGIEVYSEEHFPTSNSNGLVTLIIGEGLTNDNFSEIQWGDGEYFLKVEVDPEGGNSYIMNQTSQLLSVPYALYAGNSGSKLNLLGQDFITLQDQTLTVNKVDLTDDINGVLPITNGGTGSSTAPMVGVITAVDSPAARVVLGLGTASTEDATAFATAAQGALADSSLQVSNNLSDITNVVAARTALGIDVSGTDNSTNVSLAGSLDYLTLSGQEITLGSITNDDLAGSIADSKLNQIITANKVAGSSVQLASGSALANSSGLNVTVDDSSIENNSGTLRVKADGISNSMIADPELKEFAAMTPASTGQYNFIAGTGDNFQALTVPETLTALGAGTMAIQNKESVNIDGGTIDGTTVATSNITVGIGKTLDVSSGTLNVADNQISGDKIEGGTIEATNVTTLTSNKILASSKTITSGGTTGNQTIHSMAGSINFDSSATSLTVTNNLVDANSVIMLTKGTAINGGTAIRNMHVVPASGEFTIHLDFSYARETKVYFLVIN